MAVDSLANIFPTIYAGVAEIPRRQHGILRAVQVDGQLSRVTKGQTLIWDKPEISAAVDADPSCTLPCPANDTATPRSYTIEQSRAVRIKVTGDATDAIGDSAMRLRRQNQYLQAFDILASEIETYLALKAIAGASRAYGTAGTTPFQTADDMSYFANLYRILMENGRNAGNLALVLNSKSATMLRSKMSNLWKANEFGSDELIKYGTLTMIQGFNVYESMMPTHTKGTGTNYVTSGATAKGVSDIALVTGSGTVLAGDVVTFAADTNNKYVVNKGVTAPGTITLGEPGAMVDIATGNAMTIGNSYEPNLAFNSAAIGLGVRIPPVPTEGDAAIDAISVRDEVTGLVFEIRRYGEYRQVVDEVAIAYGAVVLDSAGIALGLS